VAIDTPIIPAAIVEVPCTVFVDTVRTSKSDFAPARLAIAIGDVVRFAPINPHDAVAGTFAAPQPWFAVQGNTEGCYRFDEAGEFPFFCTAHPFTMQGAITVR
jgi:plastocyanin